MKKVVASFFILFLTTICLNLLASTNVKWGDNSENGRGETPVLTTLSNGRVVEIYVGRDGKTATNVQGCESLYYKIGKESIDSKGKTIVKWKKNHHPLISNKPLGKEAVH